MSDPTKPGSQSQRDSSNASSGSAAEHAREIDIVKEELKRTVQQFRPSSGTVPAFRTRAEAKNWKMTEGQQARKRLAQLEKKLQHLQLADKELRTLSAAASATGSELPPAAVHIVRSGSDEGNKLANGNPGLVSNHPSRLSTPATGVLKTGRTNLADGLATGFGRVTSTTSSNEREQKKKTVVLSAATADQDLEMALPPERCSWMEDNTLGQGPSANQRQNQNPADDLRPQSSHSGQRTVRLEASCDVRPTTSPHAVRQDRMVPDRLVIDDGDRGSKSLPVGRRHVRAGSAYSQGSAVVSAEAANDQWVSVSELRQVIREMSLPADDYLGGGSSVASLRSGRSPSRRLPSRSESRRRSDGMDSRARSETNETEKGSVSSVKGSKVNDDGSDDGSTDAPAIKLTKKINTIPTSLKEATDVSCPWLLGGFSRESPIRMKCFQIYKSARWQTLFMGITIANCTYIAATPKNAGQPGASTRFDFLQVFDFFCVGVLLLEVAISIIAFGFVNDPTTWLRNSDVHKFDFAVVCVTVFEYVASYFGIRGLTLRPFRLLRTFKAMVQLRVFSNVKAIITTLRQGLGQLLVVFAMLLFFVAAFAVFGMAIFQNSFRRRCIALERPVPACASDFSTGWQASCNFTNTSATVIAPAGDLIKSPGYPGMFLCKVLKNITEGEYDGEYPLDPYGQYHNCKPWEMCAVMENPQYGLQHFDHIGGAMITIFQIAAPDGSYDVIWNSLQSEPQVYEAIWVYYFMISCLCTFLLLGLFVAVVTGTFKRVRETQSVKQMNGILNGLDQEDEPDQGQQSGEGSSFAVKQRLEATGYEINGHGSLLVRKHSKKAGNKVADEQGDGGDEQDDNIPVEMYALRLLSSKPFIHLMSAVVVVHCLAMAADQYNAPKTWSDYATVTYVVANLLFLAELFVRVLSFGGLRYFWTDATNQSELFVTGCGLVGLAINSSFLIRIPAVRLYRLMWYIPTLQALLFSAVASTRAVLNLVVFIALVAVCYAVAGRYVFQDSLDELTRSNFGTFAEAMLTVFQLLTGDSWSAVLFAAMSAMTTLYGTIFAAVFVMSWFIFSRLIVTNLFVAVIIENFEVSETIENIRKPGYVSTLRMLSRRAFLHMFVLQSNLRGIQVRLDKNGNLVYKKPLSATMALTEAAARTPSALHHHRHKASAILHSADNSVAITKTRRGSLDVDKNQFSSVWKASGTNFGLPFGKKGNKAESAGGKDAETKGKEKGEGADREHEEEMEDGTDDGADSQMTASFYDPHVTPLKDIMEDVGDLPHYRELVQQVLPSGKWNDKAVDDQVDDTVLGCFGPTHPLRRFCEWLSEQFLFDAVIYTAILGGCFFLVITPPYEGMPWNQAMIDFETMDLWNRVFTIVFSVEFFTRVMSKGLLFTKHAYLKSGWNVMDSLVLFFAWIDEFQLISGGGVAKVMRLARALRPLRLMKRNQGMRIVIDALISTLAPVAYVVAFSMFTFVVFSLVGIGLFGGMLFRCSSPGAEYPAGRVECSGYHVHGDGVIVPRAWESPTHNFDSFYNAMFTLFRVNTLKYVAVVTDAMDITEFNVSPHQGHSMYYSVFFIVYLIIGALFVMNLFTGFIVDGFNANKGSTQADLQFNRFVRTLAEYKPKYDRFVAPSNALSVVCRALMASRPFQVVSVTCVVLNVIFMMTDHAGATEEFISFMETQGLVFFIELCAELVISLIAFGPGGFYNDPWKAFDFFVALGSMVGYIQDSPKTTQFARTFRLMRVVRLMKMITPIRVILETLLASLPQLVNVVLLLFLVYSMFAVVAVQTFGTTRYGTRLGPTANFETYSSALFSLYQLVTGDEWHLIMDDCSIQAPACTPVFTQVGLDGYPTGYEEADLQFGDCGSFYAGFFFVVFIIVCESVMLNLFIGMILDNFSFITDEVAEIESANWDTGASSGQIIALANIFKQHDSGTCLCAISGIHFLMSVMPQPLGFRSPSGKLRYGAAEKAAEKLIRAELNLVVRQGYEEDRRKRKEWWRKLVPILCMPPPKALSQSVTFEQLMLTLLFWRKPSMVPGVVKGTRVSVINEVVVLAHALTLKDVLLKPVAARKQRQTKRALIPRSTFVQWSKVDPHFTRRFAALATVLLSQRVKAERKGMWREFRVVPPVRTLAAELVHFDMLPDSFVPHQQVVRKDLHIKFAKSEHGLVAYVPLPDSSVPVRLGCLQHDRLRNKLGTSAVALRFVDARNQGNVGIVSFPCVAFTFGKEGFSNCRLTLTSQIGLDLSTIDWEGWERTELRDDTIYKPKTRKARLDESNPTWSKVDLRMRTDQDKKADQIHQSKEYKTSLVASILDIQGFVIKENIPGEKLPFHHSKVRFNLGLFSEAASLTGAARFGFGKVPPCYDGVMEVIGYFSLEDLTQRIEFFKHQLQETSPRRMLPEDMLGADGMSVMVRPRLVAHLPQDDDEEDSVQPTNSA